MLCLLIVLHFDNHLKLFLRLVILLMLILKYHLHLELNNFKQDVDGLPYFSDSSLSPLK